MSSLQTNAKFANVPSIEMQRSTFPMEQRHLTTFNVGEIIPFFTYTDILPADTFKVDCSFVIRMETPLNPTMDDLVADIYWFYDRTRNVWTHFEDFIGANNATAWFNPTEYNVPKWSNITDATKNPNTGEKTLWDYFGLRCKENNVAHPNYVNVNAFALRSYVRIYNRFFRDENFIAPLTEDKSDNNCEVNIAVDHLGKVLKASRLPDYLSKSLPGPQRGDPVQIGLPAQSAPVIGNGMTLGLVGRNLDDTQNVYKGLVMNGEESVGGQMLATGFWTSAGGYGKPVGSESANNEGFYGQRTMGVTPDATKSGLIADLSNLVGGTVNALRLSIQTQKILEVDARRGVRLPELVHAHYPGIVLPDATINYPEYLGGCRVPISITAVANTTGTSDAPQGYLGAFSHTVNSDHMFTKSFTEWGTLMGIVVVRIANHTYSQNIPKMWTRNHRLEYYWPTLSHLGEGPVYSHEAYFTGSSANDTANYNHSVWGYQERWVEYRYLQNMISAEMRPDYAQSLMYWHYGDNYLNEVGLNRTWLEEDSNYVKRTLAVQNHDQLLADFNTKITATRAMPVFSVPSLMDHF